MDSLIFRTVARFLTSLMLIFSLFILLRGHNAPGGGFIGGLIAASAFAVYGIAFGVQAMLRILRVSPLSVAGAGLLLSCLSGVVSIMFQVPFMTGLWFNLPFFGSVIPVSTVQSFDIGVYLVVVGAFTSILLSLEEREDD